MILTAFNLLAVSRLGIATPNIEDYLQTGLKDATFTSKRVTGDQRELQKINDDFARSYRFSFLNVKLKEPFKLRLETNVEDTDITLIFNGPRRLIKVPRSNINARDNLAKKPGQRQTIFDFGLLTPALFHDFFFAKFIRTDRATGQQVFDVFYIKELDDDTRHRIWVDPTKKIVAKREWYTQLGNKYLLAVFTYEDPKEVNGIWFPTKVTVKNADNKLAGVTKNSGFKVNQNLSDSLFKAD